MSTFRPTPPAAQARHSGPDEPGRLSTPVAPDSLPPEADLAWIISGGRHHPLRLRIADRFVTRLRGLILQAPLPAAPIPQGLLITRCRAIHTAFMRYPIDVAYIDDDGYVGRCVPGIAPWRASRGTRRTAHTLELPAGSLLFLGIRTGARLHHPLFGAGR